MRRTLYVALSLLIVIGLSTVSCKKGDNDPFLSLRSRKARISGEWKLMEGTIQYDETFIGVSDSETTNYTESTIEVDGDVSPYSETLTINKTGTYSLIISEDGEVTTITGVWLFAGKIKDLDLKRKESIVLYPQSTEAQGITQTIGGLYGGEPLIIDRLANDEMIFKGETSYTPNSTTNGSTTSYEKRYVKQ